MFRAGAAAGGDLLLLQDQKIAVFASSYLGGFGRYLTQTALSLVQLTDVLEDFTARCRRLVGRQFVLGLTDQGAQLLAISFRVVEHELLQDRIVARDQAIAPAFQAMETFVVLPGGGIELIEQNKNGVSVLVAHQFADEHQVPFTRDIRGVLGRIGQCPAHGVGQRQFCQQVRLECCKALAKVNQSMQLAFNLGFAFFSRIEGVVVRINHGGRPQRNAAMITSRGPLVRPGRSMTLAESRI